jgi:hypothetical protein
LAQPITHWLISASSQFGGIFAALASTIFLNASQFSSMHLSCSCRVVRSLPSIRTQNAHEGFSLPNQLLALEGKP